MSLCCAAGFLDWGWQAGCDFVGKTCTAYAAAHPGQQYFCTKEQYISDNVNTLCTFDGLARAQCAEAPFAEGCAMKVREACTAVVLRCTDMRMHCDRERCNHMQNGYTSTVGGLACTSKAL
jgi:hypothetical protein